MSWSDLALMFIVGAFGGGLTYLVAAWFNRRRAAKTWKPDPAVLARMKRFGLDVPGYELTSRDTFIGKEHDAEESEATWAPAATKTGPSEGR